MPLQPGTKLGSYDVVESIGAGGMGEVYRAHDTKLGRDVAIKVLREELAEDDERLARFEREAKLLASLNHPAVAHLYGFEKEGGTHFLVMELVEGETLAERIARGPISFDEALPLFVQIAQGLVAAHHKGIIHRDLKPANIKITPDGQIKILDFGLAKAFDSLEGDTPEADSSQSPTIARDATRVGVILGTPAYMSPEQTRGLALGTQTDVWAFACVLYEALSGRSPFARKTAPDTSAAILSEDPDWDRLPASTSSVRRLVERCLRKDPRRRQQCLVNRGPPDLKSPSRRASPVAKTYLRTSSPRKQSQTYVHRSPT